MPRSRRTWSGSRVAVGSILGLFALSLVVLVALPAAAGVAENGPQALPPRVTMLDYRVQDAGNYRLLVTNWGQLGAQPGSTRPWAREPSLQWPASSNIDYLWVAGLWVGAQTPGAPLVSTAAFSAEFHPSDESLARIYIAPEGAPGGHRAPDPNADDDGDGQIDEDRLNGLDDDGDGQIDEDFAAISDQMFYSEYRDNTPVNPPYPDHTPLGMRVDQAVLAWADSSVDDVVGLDYTITNINGPGGLTFTDVHAGLFADADIGLRNTELVSEDDRAGFWEGLVSADLGGGARTVKVSVGYMFDANGDNGTAPGWIGFLVLGGAPAASAPPLAPPVGLVNFRYFSGQGSVAAGGDPTNDPERYAILHALDPLSLPPPDPGTGLRPPQVAVRNDDYRVVVSAGPLGQLAPGETAHVQFAIVLGAGFDAMVQNAARAILLYENGWRVQAAVGVAVHDLEASTSDRGVELAWQVGHAALGTLRGVRVQRAASPLGPYADLTDTPLAPAAAMRCADPGVIPGSAYWYRLLLQDTSGEISTFGPVRVDVPATQAGRTVLGVPVQVENGEVRIAYTLAASAPVTLDIYDVRGKRVLGLDLGPRDAGAHLRWWDGRDDAGRGVPRGVYFVRLEAGGTSATAKLLLARP